jgi:predicted translin family RNA/ssDNA-binding protein
MRLTERDLSRIVKRVVNENHNPLDRLRDDLGSISRKVLNSMDEYSTLTKKGDYKRMSDELDNLRRMVRRIKDVIQEIESKI